MENLDCIEKRLSRLESQNARLKFVLTSLTLCFLGSLLMGDYRDNRIMKNNFVVVDQAGRTRALLGVDDDQGPSLVLYGKSPGYPLVRINLKGDRAAIVIQDPKGKELWRAP